MRRTNIGFIIFLLALLLAAAACANVPETPDEGDMIDARGEVFIETAAELSAFLEDGPESAILTADIDMGREMLKLSLARGHITLYGNSHSVSSSASCAIRLDDGAGITLDEVIVNAEQTALGLLGSGEIGGSGLVLTAGINAIHAAGDVRISTLSDINLNSETGMGIAAESALFGDFVTAEITASTYAIRTGRGGVNLSTGSSVSLSASGDNCLYSEGDLFLDEDSTLRAKNSGDHNAVLVAALRAHNTARLEATGGINGMGLFIMEQYESVTLRGFSKPEVMLEAGDGEVLFSN